MMTDKKFGLGFFGYFTGTIGIFVWNSIGEGGVSAYNIILVFILAFCLNILLAILLSAIINFFMDVTGSQGSATGTFIILGVSDFMLGILIPFAILFRAASPGSLLGGLIIFFISVFRLIFVVYLLHVGYKCSIFKAIIAYIFPFLLGLFITFVFIVSIITSIVTSI